MPLSLFLRHDNDVLIAACLCSLMMLMMMRHAIFTDVA